ncbi:hypothetical protein QJQ45_029189, partial [Haematococcus lacustris]
SPSRDEVQGEIAAVSFPQYGEASQDLWSSLEQLWSYSTAASQQWATASRLMAALSSFEQLGAV